jgi:transposase-like protein
MQHKLIPYKRSMELIEDFLNHHISQGSISSFNKELYDKLEDVEKSINNQLISSNEVVHFDETLICINGKTK